MKSAKRVKSDYLSFLGEIKDKITSARTETYRKINRELIHLYWEIGQKIVEKQEEFGWGKSIVEELSRDLQAEFSSLKGFSVQNLWYMRQLYLTYKDYPNLQQLVGEIPWGQNLIIMSRVKNEREREYYLEKTLELGWTRNVLIHQIEAEAHGEMEIEKIHNFNETLPEHLAEQADKAMKDSYVLDFLDVGKPLKERELEKQLVEKLKQFLTELGIGFCFIGNQYQIKHNNKEYYLDLLFFHRKLRCLVDIELKIGGFKPEDAGKINFYLNLLDDLVRMPGENPSIGIVVCKDRDRFDIEYALQRINSPVGVSGYKVTPCLPKKLMKALPSIEELTEGLKDK